MVALQSLDRLIECKLLSQHESYLAEFNAERIPIYAIELLWADHPDRLHALLEFLRANRVSKFRKELDLKTHQFPVGDVEKVATPTRGVEDSVCEKVSAEI